MTIDSPTDQIKAKLDIVDFIGSRIELKKSGRNYKALCPFHQEKTPSFMVSADRQIWHCFGACKEGGDIFKFVMKYEGLTFYEALQELAKLAGVVIKKIDFEDHAWQQKQRLLSINSLTNQLYHHLLTKHPSGKKAYQYLKNRGISDKLLSYLGIGYAPAAWDFVTKYLVKKTYTPQELVDAGISIRSQSGKFFDRFRGRITFPLTDSRDNIIGFSGRLIDDANINPKLTGDAKYINSPETVLYKKRQTLFGIAKTKEAIIKKQTAIIVEGEFDLLSCLSSGISNVVAIKGSALTIEQLQLLKRYGNQLILALDSDFAGNQTTQRAIADAINFDFKVNVAVYENGKDPDEAIKNDPTIFKKAVAKPVPIYDYLIDNAAKQFGSDTAYSKKEIVDFISPYLAHLTNPIIKSHYIKKVAKLIDTDDNIIENIINKYLITKKRKQQTLSSFKPKETVDRYEIIQKYILSVLFQNNNPRQIYDKYFVLLEQDDFNIRAYQQLIDVYYQFHQTDEKYQINIFARSLPAPLQYAYDELLLFDISLIDPDQTTYKLDKTIYELKKMSIKNKVKTISAKQINKEDQSNLRELIKSLADIEKTIAIL